MTNTVARKTLLTIRPMSHETISEAHIRDALSRILKSSMFVQSERLGRFLKFTVETTLEGEAEMLKEYLIGTTVYGRRPSFDPGEDSIVRSEARRLRRKLQEYYQSAGKNDRVSISYRPGSYVPSFLSARNHRDEVIGSGAARVRRLIEAQGIRIAVLPFVDVSHTVVSSACGQLITDEVIHELVLTDGLRVAAASSVAPLIARGLDLPSLAGRLNLQIIFEGTVREDDNELRITCNVVTADGFQIWSERFQTARDSQAALEIAGRIASALSSRLRHQSLLREQNDEASMAAYPLVLGAEAQLDSATSAHARSALSKFRAVGELMPGYARPLCGIALSCCELALHGVPDSAAIVFEARQAADRAGQIDPQMALVPACIGTVLVLEGKGGHAEKLFQEALCLGEHAATHSQYALHLSALGRFEQALYHFHKAERIDPFSCRVKMAGAKLFYLSRDYEQGVKYISQALASQRLPIESEVCRVMMLISLGRRDEALRLVKGFPWRPRVQRTLMSSVAEALAMCGETDAARRLARDYNFISAHSPISKFRQALLSLALGDSESAIRSLCAASEASEAELIWLPQEPRLDAIRGDPRVCRSLLTNSPANPLLKAI